MSLPRQILAGATYLVTRRCTQRQFLLTPSRQSVVAFLYCLALAQRATGVQIHGVCVLSNHYHLIVTDPRALLPRFVYILNKYVAKCMNAHYGRWENLWAGGAQTSYVRLADDAAMIDKLVYTVTNPVEAGLVSSSKHWPGLLLWTPGRRKAARPDWFFHDDGPMPEELWLELTPLPLKDNSLRPRDIMEQVGRRIAERETKLRADMHKAGRKFLGKNAIRAQRHTESPTTVEPRRGLSPRVASKDKWRRIEILQRLKTFTNNYRRALSQWLDGDRKAIFPAGTYGLRVQFAVRCAES